MVEFITPRDGIDIFNGCCKQLMAHYPDDHFDIAIVDPPYGIGDDFFNNKHPKSHFSRFHYSRWDKSVPDDEYFDELRRVSKHQIVWGGNYFAPLWPCKGFIVWDKQRAVPNFASAELAWTSFDVVAKTYRIRHDGFDFKDKVERFHPTQKPIELYKALLRDYTEPGDKILDTHLGSGSIARAVLDVGEERTLVASEIDEVYVAGAVEQIKNHESQAALF